MSSLPLRPLSDGVVHPEETALPLVPVKERFFYLDAMKGIMILWGIPVHACTISGSLFFKEVAEVSGWVRMEAFYIISGFLTYMLIKRYGAKTIFERRVIATGIPLITVLLLLNPITNFLILIYHNGSSAPTFGELITGHIPAGMKGTSNWHLHVWFLIVLLIFGGASGSVIRIVDNVISLARQRLRGLPDEVLLSGLGILIAICTFGARVVYEVGLKPFSPDAFHYVIRSSGLYISFFALGMAMFASRRLLGVMSSFHWIQLLASCAFLLAARLMQPSLPNLVGETFRLFAESYLAVMLASLLFATFKKFFSVEGGIIRFISEAAFSVYLFHYLVIYLSAFFIRTFVKNDFVLSLLVTLVTVLVTMLIYEFGVRRSTVLKCLFLGKIPKRKNAEATSVLPGTPISPER